MNNGPKIKVELKQKDGDRRLDVLSLWESKNGRAGSYNGEFSIYDKDTKTKTRIVKMVTEDGKTITLSDWFVNGTHWGEFKRDDYQGRKPQQYEGYTNAPPVDDEDLPF